MKRQLVDRLWCPECRADLALVEAREQAGEVVSGELGCAGCGRRHPIVDGVPRFVPPENYAKSFGFQWKCFRRTQLDSHTGQPISRQRFFRQTGWSPDALAGALVLDVGCGAGRFAEVALGCGARVVAVDFSTAVDACRANLGAREGLEVVQADVYRLPFKPGQFDFVYCFGVLQHTPDVQGAFLGLPAQLRPAGRVAVDVYPRQVLNVLWPKYWLRFLTRRLPPARLFRIVESGVQVLWPLSVAMGRVPLIGRKLRFLLPVMNYDGILPLSRAQLREWAVLDTFDMLAPAHDHPQSAAALAAWFKRAGLREVQVFRAGLLVGRGVR